MQDKKIHVRNEGEDKVCLNGEGRWNIFIRFLSLARSQKDKNILASHTEAAGVALRPQQSVR